VHGAFVASLLTLGLAVGGFALLLALLHLQERLGSRYLAHQLGWRAVLLTGWLGVPLHELSHLVAALVFRHRIIAWSLLDPDPVSGTLGYVRHAYSQRSIWQLLGTFFIGVAPLAMGGLALGALVCWMVPPHRLSELLTPALATSARSPTELLDLLRASGVALAGAIWQERSALLPLQIYLGVCIANHIAPSAPDLKGALPGAGLLLLLLLLAALLLAQGGRSLAGVLAPLAVLALLYLAVVAFQVTYLGAVALVLRVARRRVGHATR
jgi:hypothetical protein